MNNDKSKEKQIVHVIGIGNLTRLDDGVAIRVVQELEKIEFPSGVKITDLGTGGVDIALIFDGWSYGIIIDAVDIEGLTPGEVVEFKITENNLPDVKGLSSSHGFDALIALKLAYVVSEFNLPREIVILGIQIEQMAGFGIKLSSSVEKAIPIVIERVDELIELYLQK
ncbi:MAG: hydrogenase maturation protease [Candidatus Heimdallarchaeota archaeon]